MRDLNVAQLLTEEIILKAIFIYSIHEPPGYSLSFRERPRACNVLFIYNAGRREYSVPGGEDFTLSAGDILYIPVGSRYSFLITDTQNQPLDSAIAINFDITDRFGEPVCFGSFPRILLKDKLAHYFTMFSRIEAVGRDRVNNGMLLKSLVYALLFEILTEMQTEESLNRPWNAILPAIRLTESEPERDIPIPRLAQMCGVSETRLRRLWSEYTGGVSPVDYRNRLRIDLAENLIRTGDTTVENAAYRAGFRDIPHFYRMYRRFKGHSPLAEEE